MYFKLQYSRKTAKRVKLKYILPRYCISFLFFRSIGQNNLKNLICPTLHLFIVGIQISTTLFKLCVFLPFIFNYGWCVPAVACNISLSPQPFLENNLVKKLVSPGIEPGSPKCKSSDLLQLDRLCGNIKRYRTIYRKIIKIKNNIYFFS